MPPDRSKSIQLYGKVNTHLDLQCGSEYELILIVELGMFALLQSKIEVYF